MQHFQKSKINAQGFTLVELLVVIAIISLLAAILIPTLNKVRARALEVDCSSNLRQLSLGLFFSAEDNDGYFPPAEGITGTTSYFGSQASLLDALYPYVPTNSPVWFCKRYVKFDQQDKQIVDMESQMEKGWIGYFYWGWTTYDNSNVEPISVSATNSIWDVQGWNNQHSQTIILSDRFRDGNFWPNDWQYHGGTSPQTPLDQPGSHVILSDGSVSKMAPRP